MPQQEELPDAKKQKQGSGNGGGRALGRTALRLPAHGFGSAAVMCGGRDRVGGAAGGKRVSIGFRLPSDAEADAAMQAAWDAGVRFYDTAPYYGRGQAEHRVGRFLYSRPRGSYVLQTKVGRVLRRRAAQRAPPPRHSASSAETYAEHTAAMLPAGCPDDAHGMLAFEIEHDYSYAGIMRSYEDSLQRLGVDSVDSLVVHDLDLCFFSPEDFDYHLSQLRESGWKALEELKAAGEVKAVGVGVNHLGCMTRFLDAGIPLDFFLVSQVYSLLHHATRAGATDDEKVVAAGGALSELRRCKERGVGVIAATVLAAGLLAGDGPRGDGSDVCNYRKATAEEVRRASALADVCRSHGVPLSAAALQFPLAHPCVASVVFGMGSAAEAEVGVRAATTPIPGALWREMRDKGLVHPDAPLPA